VEEEVAAERPSFRGRAALSAEMLVNFNGIDPLRARASPGGISRALSRAATALMFSLSAYDDWVRVIRANGLIA
jgi:hypothetical protein